MNIMKELHERLMRKHGQVIDLNKGPDILTDIVEELSRVMRTDQALHQKEPIEPFGVSWMDSWVAHWVYYDHLQTVTRQNNDLAPVLQSLVDLKFKERLADLKRFIREHQGIFEEPPDGGPPEPGVPEPSPPAGPDAGFLGGNPWNFEPDGGTPEPPDGGPPEPGVPEPSPPAGPDAGLLGGNPWNFEPDGGTPEPPDGGPPEPGVPEPSPPAGPDAGFLGENPWILYWFVSLKAPMLLDMIDAHISRRLEQLQQSMRG